MRNCKDITSSILNAYFVVDADIIRVAIAKLFR